TRMVRRELTAFLGLGVATAAGGEDDRRGIESVLAGARAPAVLARLECGEGALRVDGDAYHPCGVPEGGRDRVAGAVADLEPAPRRRAAAAGEPVAAVLLRERDPELLEPVDRRRGLARQQLDEPQVRRLVARAPDVLRVPSGRVVLAERGLDAALRLRGVTGLDRALGRDR